MAYHLENNDIVIDGFQGGMGDSPTTGFSDMRNINIISVPGEASLNFSTSSITSGAISGTVTSASGSVATYTGGTGLEDYISIYFTGVGSYTGLTVATPYWVDKSALSSSTFALYTDYKKTTGVTFGGSGSAAFTAYQVGKAPSFVTGSSAGGSSGLQGIQHFAQPTNVNTNYFTFGVDGIGLVWSNFRTTGTNSYWTYTGNSVVGAGNVSNAAGNGLVYWRVNNGSVGAGIVTKDYLFVIRNSQIDYFVVADSSGGTTGVWTNGWKPSDGSTGNSAYLNTPAGTINSHQAIVPPDGRVYFCDGDNIQKLYQNAPTVIFDPTSSSTYVYTTFTLLPINDVAQCIAPFGNNILIGGQGYNGYVWNTTSNQITYPVPIAEPFWAHMVTVNTNVYVFAGNRGRIYVTNGAQANLWKKVPDYVAGTIEPKFQWGGATAVKNQMYFSFNCTNNDGTALTYPIGGLWGVDLDAESIRLTNQLSYATYSGYASAMTPQIYNPVALQGPSGASLFIGWFDGVTTCGIDQPQPSSYVYANNQAYFTTDLIPIGTLLKPTTSTQVEYKLVTPLLSGESVTLYQGSYLDMGYTSFATLGTTLGSNSSTILADNFPIQQQNQQWALIRVVLSGRTNATPSFNRVSQIRIVR